MQVFEPCEVGKVTIIHFCPCCQHRLDLGKPLQDGKVDCGKTGAKINLVDTALLVLLVENSPFIQLLDRLRVIGNALQSIGYEVVYITDRYSLKVMEGTAGPDSSVVEFPIAGEEESRSFAKELLSEIAPSVIIGIERCGLTSEGLYRNMRGVDISEYNAKADYLFESGIPSVGIGDGGNEIGLGNLADIIPTVPSLVRMPCVTTTSALVIASVSNWGGYGLVAAMSKIKGKNLLPSIEAEQALVKRNVELGAVDGPSGETVPMVDGFTLEENSQTLQELHDLLSAE